MKKLFFSLCAFSLLLTGIGCEKIIDFTGEQTEPRLTLSSQAEAGEPLEAYIASSVFFLSSSRYGTEFVDKLDPQQGKVRCYVNGATTPRLLEYVPIENATSLHYRLSDYAPAPGDHIRLEAEFPGFDPVWAETSVPLEPACEVVAAKSVSDGVEVTLALKDDASSDNYYFLQPVRQGWDSYTEEIVFWTTNFWSNDVLFREKGGSSVLDAFEEDADNYFSDGLIKGQRHVFVITVPVSRDENSLLWIHLAAVDESLYWYGRSYNQLTEGEFTGYFSEGVTLYSNVHGGYGVFCSAASRWLEVDW
ncbi:MAG: DUF4249 domain-containing protein [Bacteroidales bacterium]|nr:DUF4249 domain-containing protein [Bacteroidales bacterium]